MDDVFAAPVSPAAPRGPHPWLAPILSIIAICVAVIWAYLQMRHWKEPDADYVAIAVNIVVTVVLWAVLIWAIVATYRFNKSSLPKDRPRITPLIVVCAALSGALGLGGAWYISRRPPIENKPSPIPSVPVPASSGPASQAARPKSSRPASAHDKSVPPEVALPSPSTSAGPTIGRVEQTQAPCGGGIAIGGGTANGGNCGSLPFRTLTEDQKNGIKAFVHSLPLSVGVTVGSVIGSSDGDAYATLFFPLFDGHHLEGETAPRIRTGFPDTFSGVFVATGSDSDAVSSYRDALVETLVRLGIPAHKANGSKVSTGNLELLVAFRPEEVKKQ